jgi:hypothetical protein
MADENDVEDDGSGKTGPDDKETGSRGQADGGQQDDGNDDGQDDAGDQDTDKKDSGKTFTQTELEKLIADRVARERKKYVGYDDLKKKASKFDELEASKKTEAEKLNEQLAAAQVKLQTYEVAEIRRTAATDAGLDQRYAKYITAVDEADALEQAKELAKDLKATAPKGGDLKQGSRPQPQPTESKDQLLRRMAGYGN